MTRLDEGLLQAALVGYEQQRASIDEAIANINRQLGHPRNGNVIPIRRTLSAAARKRIAAAQKARWAKHHRQQSRPVTGRIFHCKQKGCKNNTFPSMSALRTHFMAEHKKRPTLKRVSA